MSQFFHLHPTIQLPIQLSHYYQSPSSPKHTRTHTLNTHAITINVCITTRGRHVRFAAYFVTMCAVISATALYTTRVGEHNGLDACAPSDWQMASLRASDTRHQQKRPHRNARSKFRQNLVHTHSRVLRVAHTCVCATTLSCCSFASAFRQ